LWAFLPIENSCCQSNLDYRRWALAREVGGTSAEDAKGYEDGKMGGILAIAGRGYDLPSPASSCSSWEPCNVRLRALTLSLFKGMIKRRLDESEPVRTRATFCHFLQIANDAINGGPRATFRETSDLRFIIYDLRSTFRDPRAVLVPLTISFVRKSSQRKIGGQRGSGRLPGLPRAALKDQAQHTERHVKPQVHMSIKDGVTSCEGYGLT
jgi:hypothetical protein